MAAPAPARLLLRAAAAAAFSRRWLLSALPAAGTGPSCSAAAVRASRPLGTSARAARSSEDKITVHFINRDGDKLTAKGKPGDSLLDVVVDNNLDIDGFGACEGTLACSTCHLIFEEHVFEKLDAITDEEMDMLDLAYGLTETKIQVTEMEEVPNRTGVAACWEAIKVKLTLAVRSRLGCQICLKKSMDNMTVRVPEAVADVRQSVDLSKNS